MKVPASPALQDGPRLGILRPQASSRHATNSMAVDERRASRRVAVPSNRSDLTQIAPMRGRSTDRIPVGGTDEQVEVGARRAERIVAGRVDLGAGLPPAVRTDRHAGIEPIV